MKLKNWNKQMINNSSLVRLIGYIFILVYLLGVIYPDLWWGTHYTAFLPPFWKWLLLIFSGMLIILPYFKVVNVNFLNLKRYKIYNKAGIFPTVLISFLVTLLFYYFQIYFDDYGDAFQYRAYLKDTVSDLPSELKEELFSFNLLPSSGRKTVLFFYNYVSYISGFSFAQIFKWVGIICGFWYVLTWLLFIKFYLNSFHWRLIMSTVGVLAPFTQIYYGHIESYALVFTFFISWVLLLLVFYKTKQISLLWLLLLLLVIAVKVHPLCFFLVPVWGITFLSHKFPHISFTKKLLTWKGVSLVFLLPVFCVGAYFYFFIFKDYNDLRYLDGVKDIERLFLPMLSPESPLDRYNLFGWNHLFDYLNILLSWSSPALFILVGIVIKFRKKINWNSPEVIALGILFILISSLLFMINPLVSMPMDWDLFSFSAPVLILFVVILLSQVEDEINPRFYISIIAVLLILSSSFFVVNSNKKMLSKRLTSVGIRVYESYYLHSNRIIINGLNLQETMEDYLLEKDIVLEKLMPYAIPGKDPLYANLLMDDGFYYLNVGKNYTKAIGRLSEAVYYYPSKENSRLLLDAEHKLNPDKSLFNPNLTIEEFEEEGLYLMRGIGSFKEARSYFEKVLEIHPDNPLFIMYAMEACFQMNDYVAAYYYATGLIAYKYPDEKKSYRIAIHCALEAKLYNRAEEQSIIYIDKYPKDELALKVYDRLKNKTDLEEIKDLFISK